MAELSSKEHCHHLVMSAMGWDWYSWKTPCQCACPTPAPHTPRDEIRARTSLLSRENQIVSIIGSQLRAGTAADA